MDPEISTISTISPRDRHLLRAESPVSWSAIFAGATVALAASILLGLLGAGLGLQLSVGGLATRGSLASFTPILGAEAIVIQVLAAGLGGYVTGRLRHQWLSAHLDEAHFRDTAHGLVAWSLSTVAGLVLAAVVFIPYAQELAGPTAAAIANATPPDPERMANIAAQSSLFVGIGMLTSAFIAAVAARIGGMQAEHMHGKAST